MSYKADPFSRADNLSDVLSYLQNELTKIEAAWSLLLTKEIEWLHVEPTKVRTGLTVGADGTDWDPGSGEGVYTYYAGSWHKLG